MNYFRAAMLAAISTSLFFAGIGWPPDGHNPGIAIGLVLAFGLYELSRYVESSGLGDEEVGR